MLDLISVAIDAEDDFQMYSHGIYNSSQCSSEFLNHAVLAVGYGVTVNNSKYIIVKIVGEQVGEWMATYTFQQMLIIYVE